MQDLDLVVKIAEIVLFVVLAVLGVYLIISVKKVTRMSEKMEKDLDEIKNKAMPVLDDAAVIAGEFKKVSADVTAITADVSAITSDVKIQVAKVSGVVDQVRDRAESIIEFEKKAQREVETQVFDALNLVTSVSKGVKTFMSRLSGGTKKNGTGNGTSRKIHNGSSYERAGSDTEEDLYN